MNRNSFDFLELTKSAMTTPAPIVYSRKCAACGNALMTGFATCMACGALGSQGKRPARIAATFRDQTQYDREARMRRRTALVVSGVVIAAIIGALTYIVPRVPIYATANRALIEAPITMADEFYNRDIHRARAAIGFE